MKRHCQVRHEEQRWLQIQREHNAVLVLEQVICLDHCLQKYQKTRSTWLPLTDATNCDVLSQGPCTCNKLGRGFATTLRLASFLKG